MGGLHEHNRRNWKGIVIIFFIVAVIIIFGIFEYFAGMSVHTNHEKRICELERIVNDREN